VVFIPYSSARGEGYINYDIFRRANFNLTKDDSRAARDRLLALFAINGKEPRRESRKVPKGERIKCISLFLLRDFVTFRQAQRVVFLVKTVFSANLTPNKTPQTITRWRGW
jgi:hypothetical protein